MFIFGCKRYTVQNKLRFSVTVRCRNGVSASSFNDVIWPARLPSVLLLFLLYYNDACQTNRISKSTGPIFAELSGLVELQLEMISLKLVFRPSKHVATAIKFCWF